MILRQRFKDSRVLIMIGMSFLLAFNILNTIVRRFAAIPPNTFADGLFDGAVGMCMGIAIGTLLLGVWRRGRR